MAAALGKMLNQALRRGMMTAAPAAFSRPVLSTKFVAPAMLLPQLQQRMSLSSKVSAKAPRAPEPEKEEEDNYDEYEDFDPMADKSAAVKRRVLALKEVQTKYDDINKEYQRELSQLQAKYLDKYAPVFAERKDIVTGKKEVPTFEIPDDDLPAEKDIPEFWLTALLNHDKVGPYVTERDMEVLKHLVDIRAEVLVGEDRGFKLLFDFEDNKFFSAKTLEKTYILEPEDDVIPKQFVGCKIDWKDASLDPTVTQKKQRVKGKGAAKGAKPAFTIETEPCDSFFNIFDPPQIPQNPDDMEDEDLDALQEELSVDFDIGFAIKDQVIPRAVEWYTGELTSMDADGEFDEGFDGDYDDDVDDVAPRGKNFR